jgi:hypothetical protein
MQGKERRMKFYPSGMAAEIDADPSLREETKKELISRLGPDGGVFAPVEEESQPVS